ncbi:unnamed protein product, partial [Protopolystoma xenopodis]
MCVDLLASVSIDRRSHLRGMRLRLGSFIVMPPFLHAPPPLSAPFSVKVVREDLENDIRPASLADCRRHVLGVHARISQDLLTLCCQASRISKESGYKLYADSALLALSEQYKSRNQRPLPPAPLRTASMVPVTSSSGVGKFDALPTGSSPSMGAGHFASHSSGGVSGGGAVFPGLEESSPVVASPTCRAQLARSSRLPGSGYLAGGYGDGGERDGQEEREEEEREEEEEEEEEEEDEEEEEGEGEEDSSTLQADEEEETAVAGDRRTTGRDAKRKESEGDGNGNGNGESVAEAELDDGEGSDRAGGDKSAGMDIAASGSLSGHDSSLLHAQLGLPTHWRLDRVVNLPYSRPHIMGVHAHVPERFKTAAMSASRLNRENYALFPDDQLLMFANHGWRGGAPLLPTGSLVSGHLAPLRQLDAAQHESAAPTATMCHLGNGASGGELRSGRRRARELVAEAALLDGETAAISFLGDAVKRRRQHMLSDCVKPEASGKLSLADLSPATGRIDGEEDYPLSEEGQTERLDEREARRRVTGRDEEADEDEDEDEEEEEEGDGEEEEEEEEEERKTEADGKGQGKYEENGGSTAASPLSRPPILVTL